MGTLADGSSSLLFLSSIGPFIDGALLVFPLLLVFLVMGPINYIEAMSRNKQSLLIPRTNHNPHTESTHTE